MNFITTYKKLWIWLAVIALLTGLVSHGYYDFPWWSMMDMQVLMGVWFLVFGVMKLFDISWFVDLFVQYDPLAKHIRRYGLIYPFLEIILWVLYLRDMTMNYSLILSIVTAVMTAITSIGTIYQLCQGQTLHCACMGTHGKVPLWRPSLIEQAWMCLMALWMIEMMM